MSVCLLDCLLDYSLHQQNIIQAPIVAQQDRRKILGLDEIELVANAVEHGDELGTGSFPLLPQPTH
jgi:hypothetical protein